MNNKAKTLISILAGITLAGCSFLPRLSKTTPTQTPYPTNTPYPTQTPYPTFTPFPSITPFPTATLTPTPDRSVLEKYASVSIDQLSRYMNKSVCIEDYMVFIESHEELVNTVTLIGTDQIVTFAYGRDEKLENIMNNAFWYGSITDGFQLCGKVAGMQKTQLPTGEDGKLMTIDQYIIIGEFIVFQGTPYALPKIPGSQLPTL